MQADLLNSDDFKGLKLPSLPSVKCAKHIMEKKIHVNPGPLSRLPSLNVNTSQSVQPVGEIFFDSFLRSNPAAPLLQVGWLSHHYNPLHYNPKLPSMLLLQSPLRITLP